MIVSFISHGNLEWEQSYRSYLEGLLAGNYHQCREIFAGWLDSSMPLRVLYTDIVQLSLYEIGDLWAQGRISIATEHMATAITESLLNLAYPRLFARTRNGKSAVVACVATERHQIGGKMVADVFELNGWRSYFMGAGTRIVALQSVIAERRPDAVALSATMPSSLEMLIATAAAIRIQFADVPILIGGQALVNGFQEDPEHLPGVLHLKSLVELESWLGERLQNV